jgi:hypothetical protein
VFLLWVVQPLSSPAAVGFVGVLATGNIAIISTTGGTAVVGYSTTGRAAKVDSGAVGRVAKGLFI